MVASPSFRAASSTCLKSARAFWYSWSLAAAGLLAAELAAGEAGDEADGLEDGLLATGLDGDGDDVGLGVPHPMTDTRIKDTTTIETRDAMAWYRFMILLLAQQ